MNGLQVRGLGVSYGGVIAVAGIDLDVGPGELVGLIGPNGAGKTTTVDAICGFTSHSGTVHLDGADLTGRRPHHRARAGLGRTWQSVELFEDLTVRQHCEVASHPTGAAQLLKDIVRPKRRRVDAAVTEAIEALELTEVADLPPAELPQGIQKLVGVARAMSARPRVLLLDEPAAGLDSAESLDFGRRLRSLIDGGLSALLIDHGTALVFDVCDRVYVMDFGAVIAVGTPAEIRVDHRVVQAYLG